MPNEHMNPGHVIWQNNLDKEKRYIDRNLRQTLKKAGTRLVAVPEDRVPPSPAAAAAPSPLSGASPSREPRALPPPRSASTPSLLGASGGAQKSLGDRLATPFARGPPRTASGASGYLPGASDASGEPPKTGQAGLRRLGTSASMTSSRRCGSSGGLVPFGGDPVPGTASCRESMRSGLTSLTTASLRREVAEAVQMEVAKVVQPLQDKLQSEKLAREKLEAMLLHAKGAK